MANETTIAPPPSPEMPQSDVPRTLKERVGGFLSGLSGSTSGMGQPNTPLDKELDRYHQQRLYRAQLSWKNYGQYLGMSQLKIGTHNPEFPPDQEAPITQADLDRWHQWSQDALGEYNKIAGVDKEAKAKIASGVQRVQALIGLKKKVEASQGGQPAAAGGQATTIAPPPKPEDQPGASTQPISPQGTATSSAGSPIGTEPGKTPNTTSQKPAAGRINTAPTAIAPPPKPADPTQGRSYETEGIARAPGSAANLQEQHNLETYKRTQRIAADMKIEEEKAKAAARGQSGAVPRPVVLHTVSVLDARALADSGKVLEDENGEPIDVFKLPDTMSLQPYITRITETDADGNNPRQKWVTRYQQVSPNQKFFTVGNESYAVNPADVSKVATSGAGTAMGEHNVPTTTRTTDPATGQTTVATHTPQTSGIGGRTAAGAPAQTSGAAPTRPSSKKPGGSVQSTQGESTRPTAQLDAAGHIPPGAGTPQIVEGANQLLDGQDVNKLPAKTRDLSAAMARRYGWEQGKFTPKEQLLLRESTTFIDEAAKNPALKALDEDWLSRQKLALVTDSVDAKGMIHRAASTAAAQSLTSQEAEFVRMYNQLVGTISGLGQLSRANRLTESGIKRLMNELPNPATTKDSADAVKRLQRLRKEIDVAMEKGTFTGATNTTITPPPGSGKGVSVEAGGKTFNFPDQASADAFKKEAGIK